MLTNVLLQSCRGMDIAGVAYKTVMISMRLSLIVAISLMLNACDNFYFVRGLVIDQNTNQPVDKVNLKLRFVSSNGSKVLDWKSPNLTDENGRFHTLFDGEPENVFFIQFERSGYKTKRVYFDQSKNEPQDIIGNCITDAGVKVDHCSSFKVFIFPEDRSP